MTAYQYFAASKQVLQSAWHAVGDIRQHNSSNNFPMGRYTVPWSSESGGTTQPASSGLTKIGVCAYGFLCLSVLLLATARAFEFEDSTSDASIDYVGQSWGSAIARPWKAGRGL